MLRNMNREHYEQGCKDHVMVQILDLQWTLVSAECALRGEKPCLALAAGLQKPVRLQELLVATR